MKFLRTTLLLLVVVTLFSCHSKNVAQSTPTTAQQEQAMSHSQPMARNIIFMVGDGMGLTQLTAGYLENNSHLNVEQVTDIGLSKTNSSDKIITDSAAGATAFSIGEKTYNGAIGVDKNKIPKETILEKLAKEGYATGLVVTCSVTHATPASFYAHQPSRKMDYEIAADLVTSPVDAVIAGGKKYFHDRNNPDNGQVDKRNLIAEMQAKNVSFVSSLEEFKNTDGREVYFYADGHPKSILDGRDDILPQSIVPMAEKLASMGDKGFFMLVEGSQIDWGGHANESDYIKTEMVDFDQAIGKAIEFAKKDGHTLVVITADHETGGYALGSKDGDYNIIEPKFTTGGHTATMVPVYAFGPGSENFRGIYNNNEIYYKLLRALGK